MCLGACTIVDVINYGNVYCNKVAGGMFGHIYFNRMRDAGAGPNSPVYIANAINYGNVDLLTNSNTNMNLLYNVNDSTTGFAINNVHTDSANDVNYPVGALIGMIYGDNNNQDLPSLNIKNLINFCDSVDIIGRTTAMDTMNSAAETLVKIASLQYMATTKVRDFSPEPFDTDRTNYEYGIKSYYKDTTEPNNNLTDVFSQDYNGGIFNESYVLRTDIPLVDANGNEVDDKENMDMNNTDNFINDYIQFVPYSKVNDYLVDKIGLDDAIFEAAVVAVPHPQWKESLYYKWVINI